MRSVAFLILASVLSAQQPPPQQPPPNEPEWVAKSNRNTQLLLAVTAKYSPEEASSLGLSGFDEKISQPTLDEPERERRDTEAAIRELRVRLAAEKDPLVKQDLEILINAGEKENRASLAYEQKTLPYVNAARAVFGGVHDLLDDQVAADRRPAALVRLKKYTGSEAGFTPLTTMLETLYRARAKNSALLGPAKAEVDQDLSQMDFYVAGIGQLFAKYKLTGYEEPYAKLKDQIGEYEKFVRAEVLPRARTDFRLPPELYTINLDDAGVDYTPSELTHLAHLSFSEIQAEMATLAQKIAKEHGYTSADYRDVIKELKRDQLQADQVMPLYHKTLASIEDVIRRESLVTLPDRPCIVRLASAAETAEQPAPHYRPPPLINNHGQQGQFVLPAGTVSPKGEDLKYDDFTFAAASWTLTAHEARPGHDLQFTSMLRTGVSQARAIFAFNSTNVEGWALYAEWFMLPYMPDDAKLISLQLRLLRAARAFLDPELQAGKYTREQALQLLEKDVVLSEAFATEEVDRFTFRMPGQAVSYFDGYTRLLQLRKDTEKLLGPRFNVEQFHDFILSQGLLPPAQLREAVMQRFVPAKAGA